MLAALMNKLNFTSIKQELVQIYLKIFKVKKMYKSFFRSLY